MGQACRSTREATVGKAGINAGEAGKGDSHRSAQQWTEGPGQAQTAKSPSSQATAPSPETPCPTFPER